MYKTLAAAVVAAAAITAAPAAQAQYTTECPYHVHGVAYNDVLNIRAWPSPQSRIIGFLQPNEKGLFFTRFKGNWGRLYGAGNGWVNMRFVRAVCS
jgi:uncharacterized protein YgiM (DUF1202 family)